MTSGIERLLQIMLEYLMLMTDDVTAWRQNRPSLFMFKWKWHIFRDNLITIRYMITKLYMKMYCGYVTTPVDDRDDDLIHDVTIFKNMSTFWTAVTSLIFDLELRSKAQNVENWTGYSNVKVSSVFNLLQFSIKSQFDIIRRKTMQIIHKTWIS